MTKIITCSECGEVKPHKAKGLCLKCYQKQYNQIHKKKHNKYQREWMHKNGFLQPLGENKKAPVYLGIVVAEQILSKIFKNIEVMPYGNRGYDFKCNNGFLIDVKSACRHIRNNHNDSWRFAINKNKITDYFLCLAFDNRKDLNPEYIWLIPSNIINNKQMVAITESRLNKWDKYKQPINKVIDQCNIMKGDNNGDI